MTTTQQVLWQTPTDYDPYTHCPPYLPKRHAMKTAHLTPTDDTLGKLSEIMKQTISVGSYGELSILLACLRAIVMMHQARHWQAKGSNFYGDHTLFERVYNEAQEGVDALAERMIGLENSALVDPNKQVELIHLFSDLLLQGSPGTGTHSEHSLEIEHFFLVMLRVMYDRLKSAGKLSPGLDNLLQGLADKHESLVYLLKQRSGQGI